MSDRSAPPDDGLRIVESVCQNGRKTASEMAWLLPLVFDEDMPLTAHCGTCAASLRAPAGTYEPDDAGVYRRVGPPDLRPVTPGAQTPK
jgi:hypothetical protein